MKPDNNTRAFFALLQAGLWEKDVYLLPYDKIDFSAIQRIAEEQSVTGLIASGLEHVTDMKVSKQDALKFIGKTIQMEQRNQAMNIFINATLEKMRRAGIEVLLVKGQGVAQCYERPLWRSSGDIDLFLDAENYEKAKVVLSPLATNVEKEFSYFKHLGMTIGPWKVELHGNLRSRLSRRMDKELDNLQDNTFSQRQFRVWNNNGRDVLLPAPDCDALYIFTHILHHYYLEGIGLRQICDWVRLLWTYREEIDKALLLKRLRAMRAITEWKAFGAYAVEYLGMPKNAMPLIDLNDSQCIKKKWIKKAVWINNDILKMGNMGHNRAVATNNKKPYLSRKLFSLWRHLTEVIRHFNTFPIGSLRSFGGIISSGLFALRKGE